MIRNVIEKKTANRLIISGALVKMLSKGEALCEVILIGRVVKGKNILENIKTKNSPVA